MKSHEPINFFDNTKRLVQSPLCTQKAIKVSFNAPELGKTHFIVGLPPQEIEAPSAKSIAQADKINKDLCAVLQCKDGSFKQAFFAPDDDLQELLIQLIKHEQANIKAAIFSFTDGEIAQALLDAHARGIAVEIVTDISSIRDKFNKIELLKKKGIKIHVYKPQSLTILNNIMHNKFVLFGKNVGGKSLLWTGSFNFTKSAKINNQENVIILDEMHLIERYHKQFGLLKERTGQTKAVKIAQGKATKKRSLA